MKKHLLITISDDASCLYGVRFVNSFFNNKTAVDITLFYVAPKTNTSHRNQDLQQRQMNRKMAENYEKKGREALDVARKLLCDNGFASDHIQSKLIFKQFSTVKDILREG